MTAIHHWENKYGRLVAEVVGPYRNVGEIRGKDIGAEYLFSLDKAEQIVLITENRRVKVCFLEMPPRLGYLLHHQSTSVAAVCRVAILEFDQKVNAADVLMARLMARTGTP